MLKKIAFIVSVVMTSAAYAEVGEWSYAQTPAIMSGEMQPEASIASDNALPKPAKNAASNIGYLSVRKAPGNLFVVKLSMERGRALDCDLSGCVVSISFDQGPYVEFKAVPFAETYRGKPTFFPEMLQIQDAGAFLTRVAKARKISVKFQAKDNGPSMFNFSASSPFKFPANVK